MKDFIYTEKFDNYLKGKLNESEKLILDENIQQDPLLKNEVNLQQDIFKALHEERKTMLKQRLDNVPVNTATWVNITGLQWAAIFGSVFLLSTGIYYSYFNEMSLKNDINVDLVNGKRQQQILPYFTLPEVSTPNNKVENLPVEEQLKQSVENNESSVALRITDGEVKSNFKNSEPELSIPNIKRPQVVTNFTDENEEINYSDFEAILKCLIKIC